MTLDVPTLMIVGSFVAAMCGLLLVFAWWRYRETDAALWWAGGDFALAASVLLLALGFIHDMPLLFTSGLTLLVVSPSLIWAAARSFRERPIPPAALAGGTIAWLLSVATLRSAGLEMFVPIVNMLIGIGYLGGAMHEIMRRDAGRSHAQLPLTLILFMHVCVLTIVIPDALLGGGLGLEPPPLASMFGIIHFETLIYVVGSTVFLVAMLKERSELRYSQAADTDVLTGLPNRRAFQAMAARILERARHDGTPVAIIICDLDHFKAVNDTYGHAVGDRVLKVFATAARQAMRPNEFIARLGGEEFAAIFPGASAHASCASAQRIREAFAAAAETVGDHAVAATVSIGVVIAEEGNVPLETLMEAADAALYRAKLNGRNRVECPDMGKARFPHLVRVA
jgi:diguanylate cyclase (GGDEF)-like protein